MSVFNVFQTATATLKKVTLDGAGDETIASSFSVEIDPTFGWQRVHTTDNEEITGLSTIITADDLEANFDFTHRKWKLTYNGHDYNVKQPVPFYKVGTDKLEHIEVVLT